MNIFICNKHKTAVKPIIHHNSAENFKITDHKYQFLILKIIAFFADIGYLVKLLTKQ